MLNREEKWLLAEKYHGEKSFAFFSDLNQLKSGTPLAYLIGSLPFLNCKIYLDSRPLIPRPETEFWVEKVNLEIKQYQSVANLPLRILDLCAGSGCIGVALAHNNPALLVDFIELDQHQNTITKNCLENGIETKRFRVFTGDLFSPLSNETYDFILSNPPYIDQSLNRVDDSVKTYEPALALYGGQAGMEIIAKIIAQASKFLVAGGQLWLEHEPEQVKAIEELSKSTYKTVTHADQYRVPRFSQLMIQ